MPLKAVLEAVRLRFKHELERRKRPGSATADDAAAAGWDDRSPAVRSNAVAAALAHRAAAVGSEAATAAGARPAAGVGSEAAAAA